MSHTPPVPPKSIAPYPLSERPEDQERPQNPRNGGAAPEARGILAELQEQFSPLKVGAAAAVAAAGVAALVVGRRIARRNGEAVRRSGDNQSKRGGGDRRRVAKGEGYEVTYFANKHRISLQQARDLIDSIGNDRAKLNAAASKLESQRRRRS